MNLQLATRRVAVDWHRRRAATEPAEVRGAGRDDVRLLVTEGNRLSHRRFPDLPKLLRAGDLVVVNTSATLPAAIPAVGGLRVHLSTAAPCGYHVVEVRRADREASRPLGERPPPVIELAHGGRVVLLGPYPQGSAGRLWLADVDIDGPIADYLRRHGAPIRYPYVTEPWPLEAYQTVFGVEPGSAEMPSAGRAFTAGIVTELATAGIPVAPIVLHTGVSSLEAAELPYPEWFSVPEHTARLVNTVRAGGGRVVAVGTTVVRALESAATPGGRAHPGRGWTDLVVGPSRGLHVVDALLTGWHEPGSSHLDLLEAVAGPETVSASYAAAVDGGYLWHEFGDLHLLFRTQQARPAAAAERAA